MEFVFGICIEGPNTDENSLARTTNFSIEDTGIEPDLEIKFVSLSFSRRFSLFVRKNHPHLFQSFWKSSDSMYFIGKKVLGCTGLE